MKKVLLSLAAATALTAAALPAAAQSYWDRGDRYDQRYDQRDDAYRGGGMIGRLRGLEFRVDRAERAGRISHYTAHNLRRQIDELQRMTYNRGADGMSRYERADLERRYDYIAYSVDRGIAMGNNGMDDRYAWRR